MKKCAVFANALKESGVGKGDRVAIYLPMIPELAITMMACARIGAIHSIVFGGFSSEALANRIIDSHCKVLVTSDGVSCAGGPSPFPSKAMRTRPLGCAKTWGTLSAPVLWLIEPVPT